MIKAISKVMVALVAGLVVASSCPAQTVPVPAEHWKWGTIAEATERVAVIDAVTGAVSAEDFAKLNALEIEYRGSNGSTPSGASKLALYYAQLVSLARKLPAHSAFIEKWTMVSPQSPALIILKAELLNVRAWSYRGEGDAGSVAPETWKPFHESIEAAVSILEENKKTASVDPEFYAEMEDLYRSQARSVKDFQSLLDEVSLRYPYYYDIYYTAYLYYQPQWFGSNTDLENLARYAIEKTRPRDGTSVYFRIYWDRVLCNCYQDLELMD
jgi:hypothetical protein